MTFTKNLQLLRRRQVPRSWLVPMVSLPHLFMDWPPDVSARRFFLGMGDDEGPQVEAYIHIMVLDLYHSETHLVGRNALLYN